MPLTLPTRSRAPKKPPPTRTGEKQTIPARHGTATFVPKGHSIKIINTYGSQVVDTWVFALGDVPTEEDDDGDEEQEGEGSKENWVKVEAKTGETKSDAGPRKLERRGKDGEEGKGEEKAGVEKKEEKEEKGAKEDGEKKEEKTAEGKVDSATGEKREGEKSPTTPKKAGWSAYIPSVRRRAAQQPVEKAADEDANAGAEFKDKAGEAKEQAGQPAKEEKSSTADAKATTEKSAQNDSAKPTGWSAYIPSIPQRAKAPKKSTEKTAAQKEREKLGWSAYLPSGQGFSSYLPSKSQLSAFVASHERDPTKSYAEQLYDFSKTPVGAAGLSAATGSGYASSLYAAYSAYSAADAARHASQPPMEYLSLPHTRTSTLHLTPRVGDTLVSNLRAPLVTLTDDTSPGAHDTLVAACDPQRYRELGAEKWAEHGSCAENLVVALRQINASAGLSGRRAIGADVSVYAAPTPWNLFMNVPVALEDDGVSGEMRFEAPRSKKGDFVRLRAERDVVVVMSACPMDVTGINGKRPMVAHFVVEGPGKEERERERAREEEVKRVMEKAKARTEAGKGGKQGAKKEGGGTANAKVDPPVAPMSPKPVARRTTSTASSQPAAAKPVPQRKPSQQQQQPPTPVRQPSTQQPAVSPPLSRKPSTPASPAVSRKPSAQVPRSAMSPSPVRNSPQPGRKKPKKLERRTTPGSGTATVGS